MKHIYNLLYKACYLYFLFSQSTHQYLKTIIIESAIDISIAHLNALVKSRDPWIIGHEGITHLGLKEK